MEISEHWPKKNPRALKNKFHLVNPAWVYIYIFINLLKFTSEPSVTGILKENLSQLFPSGSGGSSLVAIVRITSSSTRPAASRRRFSTEAVAVSAAR
jgi:hypothetical protein